MLPHSFSLISYLHLESKLYPDMLAIHKGHTREPDIKSQDNAEHTAARLCFIFNHWKQTKLLNQSKLSVNMYMFFCLHFLLFNASSNLKKRRRHCHYGILCVLNVYLIHFRMRLYYNISRKGDVMHVFENVMRCGDATCQMQLRFFIGRVNARASFAATFEPNLCFSHVLIRLTLLFMTKMRRKRMKLSVVVDL